MNDNYHYAQMILTMIVTVCLVYLALNNFALFLAMATIVKDCVEYLCPQDRFIIEAIYYEQVTYEVLGERLGVSNVHAWRLAKTAIKNLQCQLLTNEYVTDYLDLGGGDEEQ